jgi:hypothetical protein
MPDTADSRGRRSIWPILLLLIAALLIGMGGMAWIFHRYQGVAEIIKPAEAAPEPPPPERTTPLVNIAPPPPAEMVDTAVSQRFDQIEEKVDDLKESTQTATSEAHRAEGLLIAFAVRRAIDRGAPLGYLEGVLRDRFAAVEPHAVATVISAARRPVTIAQLRDQLDALKPQLASAPEEEGWWDGFRRELAGLIVIRKATTPSTAPIDRLTRAQDDLAVGHVDAALVEVARLPGRKAAAGWIAEARRYVQTRAALDRIESAALLEPLRRAGAVEAPDGIRRSGLAGDAASKNPPRSP